jgi:hypothetical protein
MAHHAPVLEQRYRNARAGAVIAHRDGAPAGIRNNGLPTDKVSDPYFLLGLWPNNAKLYTRLDGGQYYIAPYALAVDKRIGDGIDFAWQRDPFQLGFKVEPHRSAPTIDEVMKAGDPNREGLGVDYLLAYWLAVYLGVLPKPS